MSISTPDALSHIRKLLAARENRSPLLVPYEHLERLCRAVEHPERLPGAPDGKLLAALREWRDALAREEREGMAPTMETMRGVAKARAKVERLTRELPNERKAKCQ